MSLPDAVHQWWVATLLGQQSSVHPIFGHRVKVRVEGNVVTLTGTVESADEVQAVEAEARGIATVEHVVNELSVGEGPVVYHRQTVLALFPDEGSAQLAQRAASSWTFHEDEPAEIFTDAREAEEFLADRARAAGINPAELGSYYTALKNGKALLTDTVPEDDALRIISALEGTPAEHIRTLPPEPARSEMH